MRDSPRAMGIEQYHISILADLNGSRVVTEGVLEMCILQWDMLQFESITNLVAKVTVNISGSNSSKK